MSTVDVDPSTLFGGTWERIKDKFLLCAGDSYSAGGTGGSANHTHTNPNTSTLSANTGAYSGTSGNWNGTSGSYSGTSGSTAITTKQMPSHTHDVYGIKAYHTNGLRFDIQGDGNVVLYKNDGSGNVGIWSTGTRNGNVHTGYRATVNQDGTSGSNGSGQGHTHSIPSHTHSIPSHNHSIPSHTHSMNHSHTVGNTGSSSNMPPYLTVYCWRRTA